MSTTTVFDITLLDGEFVCALGRFETPQTDYHDTYTRPCVHVLADLPQFFLFARGFVESLTIAPMVHIGVWPSIIRRNGDLLTLTYDRVGPVEHCRNNPSGPLRSAATWTYRMYPVRWPDDEQICPVAVLGVWPD